MPRSRAIRATAALAALLIVVSAWYLGSPLFVRTTVNEPLPGVVVPAPSASAISTSAVVVIPPSSGPTTTFSHRGQLQYVDALHNGKGAVLLGVTSSCCPVGDRYFLRFEDVAITNAPDVHVYLSTDRGGTWSLATSKYLGPLTA